MFGFRGVIMYQSYTEMDAWKSRKTYLDTPVMPGVWDYMPRLVSLCQGRVVILCRCKSLNEVTKTQSWLKRHTLPERVGAAGAKVLFCEAATDQVDLCVQHGVTIAVDNSLEALLHMSGRVHYRHALMPDPKEAKMRTIEASAEGVVITRAWGELAEQIREYAK